MLRCGKCGDQPAKNSALWGAFVFPIATSHEQLKSAKEGTVVDERRV